jgi:hypothetical protein
LPNYHPEQGIGYIAVYTLEVVLLLATLIAMAPLLRRKGPDSAPSLAHS